MALDNDHCKTSPLPGSVPQTIQYKLSVKLKNDGLTILELYSQSFPQISKDIWEEKIKLGTLTVNGNKCESNLILKAGWMTENIVHNKTDRLPPILVDFTSF